MVAPSRPPHSGGDCQRSVAKPPWHPREAGILPKAGGTPFGVGTLVFTVVKPRYPSRRELLGGLAKRPP
ncbi:hypothetical protein RRG08_014442 [Elysia crispata]|uniref:Uncharacterized protein n=1 Tax=Elysia crispata TaxID=231223 RepID=A0AAE1CJ31_9GAST|nr:hypothetical protein RRG08_014442 [Elysia crispata]